MEIVYSHQGMMLPDPRKASPAAIASLPAGLRQICPEGLRISYASGSGGVGGGGVAARHADGFTDQQLTNGKPRCHSRVAGCMQELGSAPAGWQGRKAMEHGRLRIRARTPCGHITCTVDSYSGDRQTFCPQAGYNPASTFFSGIGEKMKKTLLLLSILSAPAIAGVDIVVQAEASLGLMQGKPTNLDLYEYQDNREDMRVLCVKQIDLKQTYDEQGLKIANCMFVSGARSYLLATGRKIKGLGGANPDKLGDFGMDMLDMCTKMIDLKMPIEKQWVAAAKCMFDTGVLMQNTLLRDIKE